MNPLHPIRQNIAAMTDDEINSRLDAGEFDLVEEVVARSELSKRQTAKNNVIWDAEAVQAQERRRVASETAQAKWETEQQLNERSVIATEEAAAAAKTQAVYAKRAYHRSNVALWLSGIAIIVSAFFALLGVLLG